MAAFELRTQSGGLVEMGVNRSGMSGTSLYFHIDQSANIRNGESDASILLTTKECKDIIGALNDFIKFMENKDYVFTSESVVRLISTPEMQKTLTDLGYHTFKNEEIKKED